MRTNSMLIGGLAVLLAIAAGTAVWLQNRPKGPVTAAQFIQIRADGYLIAFADGMACPPGMTSRRMKLAEAKEAFSRLKARSNLTPVQIANLDGSLATARDVGRHVDATAEKCNRLGPRALDAIILHMGSD